MFKISDCKIDEKVMIVNEMNGRVRDIEDKERV